MTADQWGKSPKVILDEHETRLWEWVQQANPYALKGAVDTACSHSDFPSSTETFGNLWKHKSSGPPCWRCGQIWYVVEKKEISDSLPTPTISPPQKRSNSELGPPPENPEAYKNYWKKFERKGGQSNLSVASTTPGSKSEEALGSSSTTPSWTPSDTSDPAASPDSATGITPDCKKKLDLEGWTMHVESTNSISWLLIYTEYCLQYTIYTTMVYWWSYWVFLILFPCSLEAMVEAPRGWILKITSLLPLNHWILSLQWWPFKKCFY